MPQHRGFKAWLQSGDDALEEYAVEQDPLDERVYTCWVPSEVGKRFTIHWESLENRFRHLGLTTIDGVRSGRKSAGEKQKGRILDVQINENETRPFMFSEIRLTDDDSAIQHASNDAEIGTIKLELRFVNIQQCHDHDCARTYTNRVLQDQVVHETTKKLGNHRVVFGDAVKKVVSKTHCHNTPVDPDDGGFHVLFKFMYRPRPFLIAQGIIPPTVRESRSPSAQQPSRAAHKRKGAPDDQDSSGAEEELHGNRSNPGKKKKEEVDRGGVRQNTTEDALSALEQQLLVTQEYIARFRAQHMKRKSSPLANARASGLVVNSDGAIDLTLD